MCVNVYTCVYQCVGVYTTWKCIWKLEDKFEELVLSFYHVSRLAWQAFLPTEPCYRDQFIFFLLLCHFGMKNHPDSVTLLNQYPIPYLKKKKPIKIQCTQQTLINLYTIDIISDTQIIDFFVIPKFFSHMYISMIPPSVVL